MEGTDPFISLISFAPAQEAQFASDLLKRIGFCCHTVNGADWLRQNHKSTGATALLVANQECSSQNILRALQRSRLSPQVLLLSSNLLEWDAQLTQCSEQFLSWPCSERELAHRLGRLPTPTAPQHMVELAQLNLIGSAPAFVECLNLIPKIASCDEAVLIEGETGTGKELAARAIHYLSYRQARPFVAVNCGAFADNLIENELFGHTRGAYTDARNDQIGLIAEAEGGTLFLDEVNSLSAKAQVSILRFLQNRGYRPLGSHTERLADVRIIAASNQPLTEMVKTRQFREDLFYRLHVVQLSMPSLRQRREDIALLSEHFIRQCQSRYRMPRKALTPDAVAWLQRQEWRGNVRELEHFICRQYLLSDSHFIQPPATQETKSETVSHFLNTTATLPDGLFLRQAKEQLINTFEAWYLKQLIQQTGGNVTRAAARAGTERRAFGKLMKKHHIDRLTITKR